MRKEFFVVLGLAVMSAVSCVDNDFSGRPRNEYPDYGKNEDSGGSGNQGLEEEAIYVSGVSYPEGYDWTAEDLADIELVDVHDVNEVFELDLFGIVLVDIGKNGVDALARDGNVVFMRRHGVDEQMIAEEMIHELAHQRHQAELKGELLPREDAVGLADEFADLVAARKFGLEEDLPFREGIDERLLRLPHKAVAEEVEIEHEAIELGIARKFTRFVQLTGIDDRDIPLFAAVGRLFNGDFEPALLHRDHFEMVVPMQREHARLGGIGALEEETVEPDGGLGHLRSGAGGFCPV